MTQEVMLLLHTMQTRYPHVWLVSPQSFYNRHTSQAALLYCRMTHHQEIREQQAIRDRQSGTRPNSSNHGDNATRRPLLNNPPKQPYVPSLVQGRQPISPPYNPTQIQAPMRVATTPRPVHTSPRRPEMIQNQTMNQPHRSPCPAFHMNPHRPPHRLINASTQTETGGPGLNQTRNGHGSKLDPSSHLSSDQPSPSPGITYQQCEELLNRKLSKLKDELLQKIAEMNQTSSSSASSSGTTASSSDEA